MKITLSALIEKEARAAAEKQRLAQEQRQSEEKAAELKRQAEAVAEAGNIDEYIRLKAEADRQESIAYVRKMQLQKEPTLITQEDCVAAWSDFRSGYDKDLERALSALADKRAAFIAAYNDAVNLQERACKTREQLASFIGMNNSEAFRVGTIDRLFELPGIPFNAGVDEVTVRGPLGVLDPTLAFIASTFSDSPVALARNPEAQRLIAVVTRKRSK